MRSISTTRGKLPAILSLFFSLLKPRSAMFLNTYTVRPLEILTCIALFLHLHDHAAPCDRAARLQRLFQALNPAEDIVPFYPLMWPGGSRPSQPVQARTISAPPCARSGAGLSPIPWPARLPAQRGPAQHSTAQQSRAELHRFALVMATPPPARR